MKHGVLHKPWRETRTRAEPKTYRFDSTVGKRMELLFFFLHSVVPTILFDAPLLRQTRTRLDNFHVKLIGQMMFKVECHVLLLTWARLSNKEGRNTIMTNATIHPSQPANQQLSTPFNGWKTMLECKLSRDLDCEF